MEAMEKKIEKETLGWQIPAKAKNHFRKFCDQVGQNCGENAGGAFMLWPFLPASLREQATRVALGQGNLDEEFWEQFRLGYTMAQKALRNIHKEKLDE